MTPVRSNSNSASNGADHSVHTNGASNGHAFKPNGKAGHSFGFGTRAIHVGSDPDPHTGAVIPAISLSTTYKQEGVGNHKGFEYSRSGNPNRDALEKTLASLESGGGHALAFASGSATTATVIQSLGPSAHLISVNDVYGGTFRYMTRVATTTQDLRTTFLDLEDLSPGSDGERLLIDALNDTQGKGQPKLIWVESPTNPTLRVIDIARLKEIVDKHSPGNGERPYILVDNTFASPFYTSPLLLGADIVLHSLTKYINGHSDVVMGALVLPLSSDSPDSRTGSILEKLRFLQNASGAVPSAYDCWLAQRGLKTLALRMKQHGLNAVLVAKALDSANTNVADDVFGEWVEEVIYPGYVPRNGTKEARERAKRRYEVAWRNLSPHARRWIEELPKSAEADEDEEYPPFPYSGMISFRLRAPSFSSSSSSSPSLSSAHSAHSALASTFLSRLKLFTLAESLGGVESLAELPALMTHASIPHKEREELGISEGLVRLSVGVEEGTDLVEDLREALGGL